jgi:hypothetical protein
MLSVVALSAPGCIAHGNTWNIIPTTEIGSKGAYRKVPAVI